MAKKISFVSLMDTDKIVFVAPILVFASFFHIFSLVPATRGLGKIEVLFAFIIIAFYLWDRIALVYTADKIGKKRIEAIACAIGSVLLLFIPFAPLMTWQYYNLYRASDCYSFNKQIIAAIVTVWIGTGVFYGSFYTLVAAQSTAQETGMQESSMPSPDVPVAQ